MPWRFRGDLSPRSASQRRVLIVGAHVLFVPLAYCAAFVIRFDFRVPGPELRVVLSGGLQFAARAFRGGQQQMRTIVPRCTAPPTSDP